MADKKISQLNAAATIYDADDFAVVQDGETKQANASVIKTYVRGGIAGAVVGTTDTQTLTNKTLTAPTINGGSVLDLAQLTVDGNTTLGDASGDTLTINGTGVSCPNNLNFDSNTLFIDATNNRVGIGTSSPQQPLEVIGSGMGCRGSNSAAQAAVWAQGTDFYSGLSYKGTSIYTWGSAATGTDAGITRVNLGSLYFQNLANALIWSNTSIPLIFANRSGTESGRFSGTGVFTVGSNSASPAISLDPTTANALVVNSSGTVSLSQGQIKFPATQVASSDVNTLDDYEEGSWSPTISGFTFVGADTSTYYYVKIGKLVTVNINIIAATSVTIANGASVSLPFTQERVASGVCISPNTGYNCAVTAFASIAVFKGGAAASASFTLSFSYIATA